MKERLDIVDNKHGIWRCHFAGSCSVVCPKGVDPALGIQLLKGYLLGSSKDEKKVASLIDKNLKNNSSLRYDAYEIFPYGMARHKNKRDIE